MEKTFVGNRTLFLIMSGILNPEENIRNIAERKSGLLLGDSVQFYILSSEIFLISILIDIVGKGQGILTVYDGLVIALTMLIISFGTSIGYFLTNNLSKSTVISLRGIATGIVNGILASLYLILSPEQFPVIQCFLLILSVSYVGSYKREMSSYIPKSYLKSRVSIPVASRVDGSVLDNVGDKKLPSIDNILLGVILLFLFYIALSVVLGLEVLYIASTPYVILGFSVLVLGFLILCIVYYKPLRRLQKNTDVKTLIMILYNVLLSKSYLLFFAPIGIILIYYTPYQTPNLARVFVIIILSTFISIKNKD